MFAPDTVENRAILRNQKKKIKSLPAEPEGKILICGVRLALFPVDPATRPPGHPATHPGQ